MNRKKTIFQFRSLNILSEIVCYFNCNVFFFLTIEFFQSFFSLICGLSIIKKWTIKYWLGKPGLVQLIDRPPRFSNSFVKLWFVLIFPNGSTLVFTFRPTVKLNKKYDLLQHLIGRPKHQLNVMMCHYHYFFSIIMVVWPLMTYTALKNMSKSQRVVIYLL